MLGLLPPGPATVRDVTNIMIISSYSNDDHFEPQRSRSQQLLFSSCLRSLGVGLFIKLVWQLRGVELYSHSAWLNEVLHRHLPQQRVVASFFGVMMLP